MAVRRQLSKISGGSTLGTGAQPPPKKIVARHPSSAVRLTHCGQLILRKLENLKPADVTF